MDRPTSQPTLETPRLRLRPISLTDAPAVQALAGTEEVASTTLNVPHPYEDGMAETWILSHAPGYEADEQAVFAMVERDNDELVGAMGLLITRKHERAELGYWVGVPFWNRGYATEAALALLRFGFEELRLHRIFAQHMARNPASGRVMQKAGMRHEATLRHHVRKWGQYEDIQLYGILVDEWRAM